MTVEIVRVKTEDVLPVRLAAFSALGASPGGGTPQDDLADTIHSAVRVDGQVVCVSTLSRDASPRNEHQPVWRIRGMATLPDHQGSGYGSQLLLGYIETIASEGGGLLWGDLRIDAVPFYERHGFSVQEDIYATSSGALHRYGELMVQPR